MDLLYFLKKHLQQGEREMEFIDTLKEKSNYVESTNISVVI